MMSTIELNSDEDNEVQIVHVRHKKKRRSDDGSAIDIKKKKKKRKSQADTSNDSYIEHNNNSTEDNDNIIEENDNIKNKTEWDDKSTKRLFKRIQKQHLDADSSYKNVLRKLNWDKVVFNDYTAQDCKLQWKYILKKVKIDRTISEVLEEGRSIMEEKAYIFHVPAVQKLKKPLSSYFLYMIECRKEVAAKFPLLGPIQLSSVISKMFNELSDKKKEQYHNIFLKNSEIHKKEVIIHSKKYPKLYMGKEFEPKIKSSMQLYLDIKCDAHIKIYPKVSKIDIINEYKKRWTCLSDEKKLKYIKKVQVAYIDYSHDSDIYMETHKNFKKKITFLTVSEQDIWERYSGKPILENRNAYQVYKSKHASSSIEIIAQDWKMLDNTGKNIFVNIANEGIEDYLQQYDKYIDKLPDDCRQAERDKIVKISTIKLLKEHKTRNISTNSVDKKIPKKKQNGSVKKIELIDSDDSNDE